MLRTEGQPTVRWNCECTGPAVSAISSGRLKPQLNCIVDHARVFSEVQAGQAFWYENSIGLVGIAVNRGSAETQPDPRVGDPVQVTCGHQSATWRQTNVPGGIARRSATETAAGDLPLHELRKE
jgi:hypothetical protein